MPGAMQMSFVNAGGLSGTKLFTNAVNLTKVTWAAMAECLRETKCNIRTPRLASANNKISAYIPEKNHAKLCL